MPRRSRRLLTTHGRRTRSARRHTDNLNASQSQHDNEDNNLNAAIALPEPPQNNAPAPIPDALSDDEMILDLVISIIHHHDWSNHTW
jgi:hypothetical protein